MELLPTRSFRLVVVRRAEHDHDARVERARPFASSPQLPQRDRVVAFEIGDLRAAHAVLEQRTALVAVADPRLAQRHRPPGIVVHGSPRLALQARHQSQTLLPRTSSPRVRPQRAHWTRVAVGNRPYITNTGMCPTRKHAKHCMRGILPIAHWGLLRSQYRAHRDRIPRRSGSGQHWGLTPVVAVESWRRP